MNHTWSGIVALVALFLLAAHVILIGTRRFERKRSAREIHRLAIVQDHLKNLTNLDPLTFLPNRRALQKRLDALMQEIKQDHYQHVLMLIDLDHFKNINDSLGLEVGDQILQEVSRRITANLRESDLVIRMGGDEFAVLLEEMNPEAGIAATHAGEIARELMRAISLPFSVAEHECLMACSLGITVFGAEIENANQILQQAEIALYKAKQAGRNRINFFEPALQSAVNARLELENELRHALQSGELELYFQPQLERGMVVGAEALSRWHHPSRGLLPPGEFIPLAEETGLILPLGDWVLEAACQQIALWSLNPATRMLSVAANISAGQFSQPDFVEHVLKILERTGADPKHLQLEITESALLDDIDDVIAKMKELRRHGLRFALDDFGTGYASLSYLKRLPIDQLKIDRSFVGDIMAESSSAAIVQAVMFLGRALGLQVIAEGVESEEQRHLLSELGCQAFQGYLYSRPVPSEQFEQFYLNWRRGDGDSRVINNYNSMIYRKTG